MCRSPGRGKLDSARAGGESGAHRFESLGTADRELRLEEDDEQRCHYPQDGSTRGLR